VEAQPSRRASGERYLQPTDVAMIEDVRSRLDRGDLDGFRVAGELLEPLHGLVQGSDELDDDLGDLQEVAVEGQDAQSVLIRRRRDPEVVR
jgi:hypothetical protein